MQKPRACGTRDFPSIIEEPEVVVRYKSDEAKEGLLMLAALSPAWGLWAPYVCLWLLKAVLQGGLFGYFDLFLLALLYISITALAIYAIFVCLDDKIVFTHKRIKFPLRFLNLLNYMRNRSWSDLEGVEFTTGVAISREPKEILLKYNYGAAVPLSIQAVHENETPTHTRTF